MIGISGTDTFWFTRKGRGQVDWFDLLYPVWTGKRGGESVSVIKERHVKCPYEKQCTSEIGYCHRWKLEATSKNGNRMHIIRLVYDCNRPLSKV